MQDNTLYFPDNEWSIHQLQRPANHMTRKKIKVAKYLKIKAGFENCGANKSWNICSKLHLDQTGGYNKQSPTQHLHKRVRFIAQYWNLKAASKSVHCDTAGD